MDLPVRQDGPPPGGFFPIRFGKRIPNTGPAGTTMLMGTFSLIDIVHCPLYSTYFQVSRPTILSPSPGKSPLFFLTSLPPSLSPPLTSNLLPPATLGVMTYGWFQVRRGMDNRAAEKEEKRRARLALVPTLVAERDARMAAYQAEWNELEAKVGGTAVQYVVLALTHTQSPTPSHPHPVTHTHIHTHVDHVGPPRLGGGKEPLQDDAVHATHVPIPPDAATGCLPLNLDPESDPDPDPRYDKIRYDTIRHDTNTHRE